MKQYILVKKISKFNIYLAICCFLVSIILLHIDNNSADADDNGQGMEYVTINKEKDSVISITTCSDSFSNAYLEHFRKTAEPDENGARKNLEPELEKGINNCYTLRNSNNFSTVSQESAIFRFLTTTYHTEVISSQQLRDLKSVWGRYGRQLFELDPDFKFEPAPTAKDNTLKTVTLYNKEAIDNIKRKMTATEEEYTTIQNDDKGNVTSISIILTEEGYYMARNDSTWLAVNDAIYNLCNDRWGEIGVDFSKEAETLNRYRDDYLLFANMKSEQITTKDNVKITLTYPEVVYINPIKKSPNFELDVDISANPTMLSNPDKAYIKVYLKPEEKYSSGKYILIEESTGGVYQSGYLAGKNIAFDWNHIYQQFINKIYEYDASRGSESTSSLSSLSVDEQPYYDPNIPKKYSVHIKVFKSALTSDSNLIGEINLRTFFTANSQVNESSFSVIPGGKNIFSLFTQDQVPQNTSVPIKFAVNSNASEVQKVVLFACNQYLPSAEGNSDACTLNGVETIKGVWVIRNEEMDVIMSGLPNTSINRQKYSNGIFKNLEFNKEIAYSWDTSGLAPGTMKSIMLKAFYYDPNSTNLNDPFSYYPGSKTTAKIQVAVGNVAPLSHLSSPRSNVGNGLGFFRDTASSKKYGSSVNSIDKAVERVADLSVTFLGFFAFIAVFSGGFLYITSAGGDEKRVAVAKKAVVYALIGLLVAFISWSSVLLYISFFEKGGALPSIESLIKL